MTRAGNSPRATSSRPWLREIPARRTPAGQEARPQSQVQSGSALVPACVAEDGKPPARKLVKARLRPDLHDRLTAYAEKTHRSLSSAAEHLIALGLDSEDRKTDS